MKTVRGVRLPVVQPIDTSIRHIALTQGKVVVIGAHRYDWAMRWMWHAWWSKANDTYYARRACSMAEKAAGKPYIVYMHHEIMQTPKGLITDHKDGDGLNNRDSNIRIGTHSKNQMNRKRHSNNTTGFRGVKKRFAKRIGSYTWSFHLQANHKMYSGYGFLTPEAAAAARDKKAAEIHGEFARLTTDD